MCGQLFLDTMHMDHANLIMQYLSIWWSDLKIGNTVATIRISRSFSWYVINDMMHVMQRQNDVCNARTEWCKWWFFFVHGWLFESFSLIKSWVQNQVSTPSCVVLFSFFFVFLCFQSLYFACLFVYLLSYV